MPLQAELIKHVNARNLAKGGTIFARVTVDWSGPGCVLRRGAILEGEVELAEPHKGRSPSRLALSFRRAQCNGSDLGPVNMMLVAVARAPSATEAVPGVQLTTASRVPGGVTTGGVTDMNIPRLQLATEAHRFPLKKNMHAGDVLGIRGLTLTVGAGPDHRSVLTSANSDVFLSTYTQILLLPESEAITPAATPVAAAAPPARVTASPAPRDNAIPEPPARGDELDACAPPVCAVDLPVTAQELEGHTAASIAVHPLGYKPRVRRVLDGFDEDQALAWMGPDKLLFTFNFHPLIRRTRERGATARIVRAVLLDAREKTVIRSLDWEIHDSGQYIWQLDGSRILVHVGDELRVYSDDLVVQRTIQLTGPLAFLRISPNGELMAVAILRERHSPELHVKLREELGSDPEEDVEVQVLDHNFDVISSTVTASNIMPPTLLNEGQVVLFARPDFGYRMVLNKWANTTDTMARFESACTPRLASVAPDLLFLVSCDGHGGGGDFRVVRNDGKLMLRGNTGPAQAGLDAAGNAHAFAVKMVTADRDMAPGVTFTAADLRSEEVRVYRVGDGKRLLSVRVDDPSTSRASYALSPDGAQLAVLSGTEIKVFPVPEQ